MSASETRLRQGLADLDLSLSAAQINQLLAYLALIVKWTKVYNLTAVRDPAGMVTHHLLDSLAIIQPLRQQIHALGLGPDALQSTPPRPVRLLDVGSGAGLPGVVIAICCPEISVHCVDTVAKKAAFITQVAAALMLPKLSGIHARVENLIDRYDIISARAFASLADFTRWSAAALAGHGLWMAMKGKYPADEIAALPGHVNMFHVEQLQVPGLAADRCIVWMRTLPLANAVADAALVSAGTTELPMRSFVSIELHRG